MGGEVEGSVPSASAWTLLGPNNLAPPRTPPYTIWRRPPLVWASKVLVVEDNPTNRLIATKMLEHLGGQVSCAFDGAQGVEAVIKGGFDLVFMDIQMPVMDGVEATRAIRALPEPLCRTPIVAMTANAMSHQIAQYRMAGMDGSVAKPLSPAALLAELARLSEAEPDAPALKRA